MTMMMPMMMMTMMMTMMMIIHPWFNQTGPAGTNGNCFSLYNVSAWTPACCLINALINILTILIFNHLNQPPKKSIGLSVTKNLRNLCTTAVGAE